MDPTAMAMYAKLCGETLARAHARSGDERRDRQLHGLGRRLDRAMADFAELYADQNERDYATVKAAIGDGRLEATEGL